MGSRLGIRRCTAGLALLLASAFAATPAVAEDFVPHGSIKLEYERDYEKRGDEKKEQSSFRQEYEFTFDGYIWRHDFLTFESSFSYRDTMEDDSTQGDSRDRDVDLYDITAHLLPDWPTPMTIEVKKNIIILNSDQTLDTRSEEDTYRFQLQVLDERVPEMDFEFERIDDVGSEIGENITTEDTQRDTYRFTISDTVFERAQLKFEYQRDEDRDNMAGTEDVSNAYIATATADLSSNLIIDVTAEYRTNDRKGSQEISTVVSSFALREDVDSVVAVSFYDATLPALDEIGDHMAILLTSGALDFTDWTPSGFTTTIDDVNNNQLTFDDPIDADVMVVIEYQTQDSRTYFDIYRGDGIADTFLLTVTQVVITEGFDDYLVFAEYISIPGGLVTLDFTPLTAPEPIDSAFPLTNVDVSIEYNTRSGNHFVDDFSGVDITQSGAGFDEQPENEFVLSRISTAEDDEERLFEIEISYLPTPLLDLNFRYEFDETENETEKTTEHSWEAKMKYLFTDRLTSTTELSYDRDKTDGEEDTASDEWNYMTKLEYTRPLGWGDLDASYEFEFDTREDEDVSGTDSTTHSIDADLTMGRTKFSSELEYDREEKNDFITGESTWATEFGFDIKAENKRTFRNAGLTTTLEYEYEIDKIKGEGDFTRNTYSFDEDIDYKNVSLETSAEYQDEESGEGWTKELELDAEVKYTPFAWLDLSSGINWTKTENEQDDSTGTDVFIEGDIHYQIGPSATVELGARREWLRDNPGENEKSFEFDAKISYIYAEFKATLELDYDRSDFDGESDNTEDYGFTVTLEREF